MKLSLFILMICLSANLFAQPFSDVPPSANGALSERLQEGLVKLLTAEGADDQASMLDACRELGQLYEDLQYFSKALTYYQQGASIANSLDMDEARLEMQTRMADALFHDGKMEEAIEAYEEVYEQHQIFRQYKAAIRDLEHLAEANMELGRFKEAAANYLTIRELATTNDDLATAITAANNLGFTASRQKDYRSAVEHFTEAKDASEHNKLALPAHLLTNLGIALHNHGDHNRSLQYLLQAEQSEKQRKSYIQHLISSIYLQDGDIYNALKFNELAISSAKSSKDMQVMCDAYDMASLVHQKLYEYDKALDFFKQHLTLKDSLQRMDRQRQTDLRDLHAQLDQTENELRRTLVEDQLKELTMEQLELTNEKLELEGEKRRLLAEQQQQQLALMRQEQEAKEANLRAAQLESERTRQALLLATQQLLAEKQQREITDLNQQRSLDSLQAARQAAEDQQKIALLETKNEVARLQAEQTESFRRNIRYAAALVGMIFLILLGSWLYSRRLNQRLKSQNERIEKQNEEIEAERHRAESLLLNILPAPVALELKLKGEATPKHYEAVTVLFTDFQGFTRIAASMPPGEVVRELNECFLKFDEIAERHNLEKIKTMGDAYMCAGGLPEPNNTHFFDAVNAAKEIIAYIEQRNRRLEAQGRERWPIRIGIHTGELVAGVVGKKKFAYDIWGDTVNVASRMETNSEPGHINISEATYDLVKEQFNCQYRGEVEVKNKGKMGMYLVDNNHN